MRQGRLSLPFPARVSCIPAVASPPLCYTRSAWTPTTISPTADDALIEECRLRSLRLLHDNLTPHGILAATPGPQADERRYSTVFTRDAAICGYRHGPVRRCGTRQRRGARIAYGGRPSGPQWADSEFRRPAGEHEADFWYLGCIDATLWWLIALRFLDTALPGSDLTIRLDSKVRSALKWLACQEHPHFGAARTERGERLGGHHAAVRIRPVYQCTVVSRQSVYSSSWMRIRPTQASINCSSRSRTSRPDDVAGSSLAQYARERARRRDLYLSFLNFSFWGEEGDTFGNLLAILFGLADDAMTQRILLGAGAGRACTSRIRYEWCASPSRARQALAALHASASAEPRLAISQWRNLAVRRRLLGRRAGRQRRTRTRARADLTQLARANRLNQWEFNEWLHGATRRPAACRTSRGMRAPSSSRSAL